MELGFQIAIVSGISYSLSCTPGFWILKAKNSSKKIADFKLRHNLSLTINKTLSSRIPEIPNKGD